MKKVFLTAASILAFFFAKSQNQTDSSSFKSRKLKVEEVNLVSSYYNQDGRNAAVTGGIGSEKLTDIANVFDVQLIKYDKNFRKHTFDAEVGIDHYTSASSDMIDLSANSSASHADTRFYPSINWTVEQEKKGNAFGVGLSSSTEFDYQSFGGNIRLSQKTKDKSGEFSIKLQAFLDQVSLIAPLELRTAENFNEGGYERTARNTFAASLTFTQIINERLDVALLADVVQQKGYLSLPFHRVYFNDNTVHQENLPNSRFKIPLGFRLNYFLGDKIILRTYYRYYTDNWGLNAHTLNLEMPIKFTPFLSVSPFYRFYNQNAIDYFDAYRAHTAQDNFYTSNYDLSTFNSDFYGAGFRFAPPKNVLGIKRLSMIELRYGRYTKNIGMQSNILSMNLKFK